MPALSQRHFQPTRRGVLGLLAGLVAFGAGPVRADRILPAGLRFASIDGGDLALDSFAGRPILLVNTASRCGYTPQYEGLQALHERFGPAGLVVLAVPSDDFRQELASAEAVKEFCEVTFGLTLPMSDITHVRGRKAHPVYAWLRQAHGVRPRWNFHKVLIGPDGAYRADWDANTPPNAPELITAIQSALADRL